MARITHERKEQRREEILSAAIALFARKGSPRREHRRDRRARRHCRGHHLRYFPTKDELLIRALESVVGRLCEELRREDDPNGSTSDRLMHFIRNHLRLIRENPDLARFLIIELRQARSSCCATRNTTRWATTSTCCGTSCARAWSAATCGAWTSSAPWSSSSAPWTTLTHPLLLNGSEMVLECTITNCAILSITDSSRRSHEEAPSPFCLLLFTLPLWGRAIGWTRPVPWPGRRPVTAATQQQTAAARQEQLAAYTNYLPTVTFEGGFRWDDDLIHYDTGVLQLPIYDVSSGHPQQVQTQFAALQVDEDFGQHTTASFSMAATQPLFTGGKIWRNTRIRTGLHEVAQQQQELHRQETLLGVDEAYWRVAELTAKVRLAEQYREAVQQHVNELNDYLAAGLVYQQRCAEGAGEA
jgi:AcrR family transcriptional regulator